MKKFLMRRLGVSDDPTSHRPSLHDCIEAVLLQSDTLIDDVLKGLEASLARTKVKVAQIHHQPTSKPAVELLRAHEAAVRATFGVQLRLAIYNSGSQDQAEQPLFRFEDLQLLEEKQIDANIEFALAQQEIFLAVEEVLPPLNALISSLLGWLTVQSHHNPLKPDVFARALRECLVQHVPDEELRAGLITPAAGLLGVSLRQLYLELTDWLKSQGVEPAGPVGHPLGGGATSRSKVAENSVTRTLLTLDKLRRLLSGELDSGGSESGTMDFLHTVPASMVALEDMKMVEPMMKRLTQRASQPSAKVEQSVDSRAKGKPIAREQTHSKKLGKQLGEEVVRLMLDNLMQDERMLLKVREVLKTLEPVLLRLSQSDPRFFSERKHPARQLLDKLTHRSLGYSSENDEGFFRFLASVTRAVEELARGDGEAESFARVLSALEMSWSRDEGEQRQRHEEAARALLHAEQRNLLAQRLVEDFQERLKGRKIPDLVVAFLCGPWAQVVAESQLSCADGTSDTDGYLALVDDLIWSVQVRLARRNRVRLVQLVPTLLVKLRQGLQLIQYPEERIPVFFDELIGFHEKAFEGPRAAPKIEEVQDEVDEEATSEMGQYDASDVDAFWVGEHEASEAGYLAEGAVMPMDQSVLAATTGESIQRPWTAADLIVGSWVELTLNGVWVRAQLTWASPHRTLFMFISGRGLAHSMSRRTMDRLRTRGLMRVVSDGHVIDNALDGVAQTALRNDRAKTGP